ncbi:MAG: aspartate carbamoyltransferase regulatory subunit [Candidatus Methanomethylicia archaeon]|nr:aspartate carbamoyltransferase regulatory subunit [Candidatus Methanomethylicia archaeon]MCX8169120.1 aspartate carbamoyltransferase regulatory subunit [Candidatus Methanomethylicia archaeon]MDW7988852.1 aspartate carbamoyltransferase regulatory subunit [Nitrososphaerota archaeon]
MLGKRELKVEKIKEGTVIDHIPAGSAFSVLKILGITGKEGFIVTVACNVPSKKYVKKDIVKIEGKELKVNEANKIALIAPTATINIIRNYEVIEKYKLKLPNEIVGIVKCTNPLCITKDEREPITSRFKVVSERPIRLRCEFCERILELEDIEKQF